MFLVAVACLLIVLHPLGRVRAGAGALLFRDEFHHGPLNARIWDTCYRWGCGGANGELERYQAGQVSVTGGKLDLRANVCQTYRYCSGMVTSAGHFSFEYGYVEARVKIPVGKGLWPAMWLLAENGQAVTELDAFELLGDDPHTIYCGVHWLDASGHHRHDGGAFTGPDFSAGYHIIGVDWRADHISWYVDGRLIRSSARADEIPHTAMYLIFNLAAGGDWPGSPDAATLFPADYLIDWVRVWR